MEEGKRKRRVDIIILKMRDRVLQTIRRLMEQVVKLFLENVKTNIHRKMMCLECSTRVTIFQGSWELIGPVVHVSVDDAFMLRMRGRVV